MPNFMTPSLPNFLASFFTSFLASFLARLVFVANILMSEAALSTEQQFRRAGDRSLARTWR
jgi:hypothetical protein